MTVGERIRDCRKQAGMSQERVAAALGVSRQAVTKWETNRSAPNTENLFRLAELFGTTVDLLLCDSAAAGESTAEQICRLYRMEEERAACRRRAQRRRDLTAALLILAAYLGIYLLGRILWCSSAENTFLGFLALARPEGRGSYLYGWLLSSRLFWLSLAVSTIPALWGKRRFAFVTLAAFVAGMAAGMLFGPNPDGAALGQDHYGWAIWGCCFLLSIPAGILTERCIRKKPLADQPGAQGSGAGDAC